MSKRVRYCPHGHDTFVTGRYSNGSCMACQNTGKPNGRPLGSTVDVCLKGHSIAEVGRGPRGRCNECRREYDRARHKPGYSATPKPVVPTERLRKLAGSRDVAAAMWFTYRQCDLKSAQSHVARLWTRPYISIDTADRWCLALGHDLAEVFPEVYLYEERHCGHCDRPVYTEPDGVLCPVCGEELRTSEGAA